MISQQKDSNNKNTSSLHTTPFESAQEAWFWFIQAYDAKNEGARVNAGLSLIPRPCEPLDILQSVNKLYRKRRLLWDHLLVLRHYGQRRMPPDPYRWKEAKSASLWEDALEKLEQVLIAKGIVRAPQKELWTSSQSGRKKLGAATAQNKQEEELCYQ